VIMNKKKLVWRW